MIYFIQSNDNRYIKIGKANNPVKRLAALQTNSPHRLKLLAVMPGDYEEESLLHKRFAVFRTQGEWFNAVPILMDFVLHSERLCGLASVNNAFLTLATHEPRLIDLYQEAALTVDDPNSDRFCANAVFFGHKGWHGIKPKLLDFVGWHAESLAPQLGTEEAYDLAYDTVYEALTDCRNCSCL
jgi:hypothetical protein